MKQSHRSISCCSWRMLLICDAVVGWRQGRMVCNDLPYWWQATTSKMIYLGGRYAHHVKKYFLSLEVTIAEIPMWFMWWNSKSSVVFPKRAFCFPSNFPHHYLPYRARWKSNERWSSFIERTLGSCRHVYWFQSFSSDL